MVSTQPILAQVQLTGYTVNVSQDLYDVSESGSQQTLGDPVRTNDGRAFRYAYAGAVALVAGNLLQSPAETTAHESLAVSAAAIGTNTITTTSTVTVTANQYAFGYLAVVVTPDIGRLYPIQSHPAATAAAVTITLNSAIDVALTTASKVSLVMNPYYGVIQCPTILTGTPVGVALVPTPINYYGWIQTHGVANVLQDDLIAVSVPVEPSDVIAGAVTQASVNTGYPTVGFNYQTGVDTQAGPVFLVLD